MENALGLVGMLVFIAATIALAAAVTYVIVKISPTRRRKEKAPTATESG